MSSSLDAPKGPGFSRRLIGLFAGLFIVVVVLFLVFLHHYTPNATAQGAMTSNASNTVSPGSTAIEEIDNIRKIRHNPALFKEGTDEQAHSNSALTHSDKTLNPNKSNSLEPLVEGLTEKEFVRGSESPLSVFQSVEPIRSDNNDASSLNVARRGLNHTHLAQNAIPATPYSMQNMQSEKKAFLSASNQTGHDDFMHAHLTHSISPFEVKAGTIIPAVLMTGINSNLPGNIIAKVRRNVYDTTTGNTLLIPQGTTILGTYDSQVAYGQSRVLMAWSRLIFPNGTSFDLDGMPGVDLAGLAGLHDKVNNHYLRLFGSALLFSVFGAAGQLSQPKSQGNGPTARDIIFGAIGQQTTQVGAKLVEKNMDIQPTISIRPGAAFNVLLSRDMVFPGAYKR